MVKIGFTGTQKGMTRKQMRQVRKALKMLQKRAEPSEAEFHHGDCEGADEQAHHLALGMRMKIVIHPPRVINKRAFCKGWYERRPVKEYIPRNHDIVDETWVLIATPKEHREVTRSGTWATVRYAKKKGRKVLIFWP